MSLPESVSGFVVFPIAYSNSSTHVLYARKHANPKKQSTQTGHTTTIFPDGRTLFLVNVPPDATEREVTLFFKHCGTAERVVFDKDVVEAAQDPESGDDEMDEDGEDEGGEGAMEGVEGAEQQGQPPRKKRKRGGKDDNETGPPTIILLPSTPLRTLRKTGQTAHIVFTDSSSVDRALSLSQPRKPRAWPSSSEPRGLAHYMALHDALRPPLDAVLEHANSAVEVYDYEQAQKRQQSKYRKGEAIVDEDGFTLVTRGGAYGQSLGGGVAVASKAFQDSVGVAEPVRKKKKTKEKEAFYAFQIHEKKRSELMDLQKKWEEDKAKVAKLKESRRFKPF